MADKNETIVTLKLKADLDGLKEALRKINDMIRSTLKAQVDITFNIRGEKRVEALKHTATNKFSCFYRNTRKFQRRIARFYKTNVSNCKRNSIVEF